MSGYTVALQPQNYPQEDQPSTDEKKSRNLFGLAITLFVANIVCVIVFPYVSVPKDGPKHYHHYYSSCSVGGPGTYPDSTQRTLFETLSYHQIEISMFLTLVIFMALIIGGGIVYMQYRDQVREHFEATDELVADEEKQDEQETTGIVEQQEELTQEQTVPVELDLKDHLMQLYNSLTKYDIIAILLGAYAVSLMGLAFLHFSKILPELRDSIWGRIAIVVGLLSLQLVFIAALFILFFVFFMIVQIFDNVKIRIVRLVLLVIGIVLHFAAMLLSIALLPIALFVMIFNFEIVKHLYEVCFVRAWKDGTLGGLQRIVRND